MYVLLAIFYVAIVMFAGKCVVYVFRARRKRWGDAALGRGGGMEPMS